MQKMTRLDNMRYKRINNMNKSIYGDLTWLDNYENIWQVGMWLADEKYDWTWAKRELAYYFEKPYKYTEEYLEWRKYMDWEMNEATEKVNGYWCWLEIQQNDEKKLSIEELSDN
jgi:hypothetical protein